MHDVFDEAMHGSDLLSRLVQLLHLLLCGDVMPWNCCRTCTCGVCVLCTHVLFFVCLFSLLLLLFCCWLQVCNHPFLFRRGEEYTIDSSIVQCGGKIVVLHNMIHKLIKTKHRMLIFCQVSHRTQHVHRANHIWMHSTLMMMK